MLTYNGSKQSHGHYGITANDTVPLLAFAEEHTTEVNTTEGNLRCIGWLAIRRPGLGSRFSQQSFTTSNLTLTSPAAGQSAFLLPSATAPHALHNSIVVNGPIHTNHPNISAFQMSVPYCLAGHVDPPWLLSVA